MKALEKEENSSRPESSAKEETTATNGPPSNRPASTSGAFSGSSSKVAPDSESIGFNISQIITYKKDFIAVLQEKFS